MKKYFVRQGISFFFLFICVSLLACSGTGSSHDSGGASYSSGGGSSSSSSSSATTSISVDQLTSLANSGSIPGVLELVSSASEGESSTTRISFSASAIGVPSGGSVRLKVTVNGVSKSYTASEKDGVIQFDIPSVPSGSTVSVRMDVCDSSGTVVLTGTTSKTVSGDTDSIAITLSDEVDVPVEFPINALFWVCNVNLDGSSGVTKCSSEASISISANLGSSLYLITGYAVTNDFSFVKSQNVSNLPVSADTSVTLELDPTPIGPLSNQVQVSFYTDRSYSFSMASYYASLFTSAQNTGLLSFVYEGFLVTRDGTWTAWDGVTEPTMSEQIKVQYRIKANGVTSGIYEQIVTVDMHA